MSLGQLAHSTPAMRVLGLRFLSLRCSPTADACSSASVVLTPSFRASTPTATSLTASNFRDATSLHLQGFIGARSPATCQLKAADRRGRARTVQGTTISSGGAARGHHGQRTSQPARSQPSREAGAVGGIKSCRHESRRGPFPSLVKRRCPLRIPTSQLDDDVVDVMQWSALSRTPIQHWIILYTILLSYTHHLVDATGDRKCQMGS